MDGMQLVRACPLSQADIAQLEAAGWSFALHDEWYAWQKWQPELDYLRAFPGQLCWRTWTSYNETQQKNLVAYAQEWPHGGAPIYPNRYCEKYTTFLDERAAKQVKDAADQALEAARIATEQATQRAAAEVQEAAYRARCDDTSGTPATLLVASIKIMELDKEQWPSWGGIAAAYSAAADADKAYRVELYSCDQDCPEEEPTIQVLKYGSDAAKRAAALAM